MYIFRVLQFPQLQAVRFAGHGGTTPNYKKNGAMSNGCVWHLLSLKMLMLRQSVEMNR